MSKITLDDVVSGFKSATKIISNFGKVEDDLNNKVLYRNNPTGEPNQMESELDMNSQRLRNLPAPTGNNDAARYIDVLNGVTVTGTTLPTPNTGTDDQALSVDVAGNQYVLRDGDALSFDQSEAGSSRRTIGAKLRESVSPEDFGAVGDGATDDLAAINAAIATGKKIVFTGGKTYRTLGLPSFSDSRVEGNGAKIEITAGTYAGLTGVSFDSIVGGLTIGSSQGNTYSESLSGVSLVTGVTGSSKEWFVTLDVTSGALSTTNIDVGDFVTVKQAGQGIKNYLDGVWEVTSIVLDTSITIKHTGDAAVWPTMTVTSVTVTDNSLQLQFDDGATVGGANKDSCFYVANGALKLGRMVIIGDYDHKTATSTGNSPKYGIYVEEGSVSIESFSLVPSLANIYLVGVLADNNSFVDLTGSSISSVSANAVQITGNSKGVLDNSVVYGGFRGLILTDSTAEGNITTISAIGVTCTRSTGDITLNAYFHDSSQANANAIYALLGNTIDFSGSYLLGYEYGIKTFGSSNLTLGSGDILNCTVGILSVDNSYIDFNTSTPSGNGTNYVLEAGGKVQDENGFVLQAERSYVAIDETASNPSNATDIASIYVDDTSSDLTVKFGDGSFTTKTLASLSSDSLVGDITTAASGAPSGVTLSSGHVYIGPILIQWGKCESTSDLEESFTFSEAFPNEVYSVQLTSVEQARDPLMLNGEVTLTKFGINRWDETNGTVDFTYIAIGR